MPEDALVRPHTRVGASVVRPEMPASVAWDGAFSPSDPLPWMEHLDVFAEQPCAMLAAAFYERQAPLWAGQCPGLLRGVGCVLWGVALC